MQLFPGSRRRRVIAMLVLSLYLPACYSWRVQNVAPGELINRDHPDQLQVTRSDSSRVVVTHPRISADSLIGYAKQAPVSLPLADVARVAERKFDVGKSVAVGVGVPAAAVGLLYVLACAGSDDDFVC